MAARRRREGRCVRSLLAKSSAASQDPVRPSYGAPFALDPHPHPLLRREFGHLSRLRRGLEATESNDSSPDTQHLRGRGKEISVVGMRVSLGGVASSP